MAAPFSFRFSGDASLSLRFALVGLLVLLLLIPLALVEGIAFERARYYDNVVADIAQGYAQGQTIVGPLLVIPATDRRVIETEAGPRTRTTSTAHIILPTEHNVDAELQHEYRHRGIYDVPVYTAELRLSGHFGPIDRTPINAAHHQVDWAGAFVTFGVSDTRGIRSTEGLSFDTESQPLAAGTRVDWLTTGVHVPVSVPENREQRFNLALSLAGTRHFGVAPLGDQSHIAVRSSWPHPKFTGTYLPASRSIAADGFRADWTTSSLARGVPGQFSARQGDFDFLSRVAAVQLFEPVTQYTVVDRGIKYGALFIALTYLSVLCFELFSGARLHLAQYGVLGLAMVLFYLVLLSLSEHLAFLPSYVVASGVIIGLLGTYAGAITTRVRDGVGFAALQIALYWVLYVLLQLVDYALLTGATLLVVGLAALMMVTRTLHRDAGDRAAPGVTPATGQ